MSRYAWPVLELPSDRPRPTVRGSCGAAEDFTVASEVTRQLKGIGRERGATLQHHAERHGREFQVRKESFALQLRQRIQDVVIARVGSCLVHLSAEYALMCGFVRYRSLLV